MDDAINRSISNYKNFVRTLSYYLLNVGCWHCVKIVRIRSCSGPHFPVFFRIRTEYGEILSVFSPNAGKCGKNVD